MKNLTNLKKVLVIVMMVTIISLATSVLAADSTGNFTDLSSTLNSTNTSTTDTNTSNTSSTTNTSTATNTSTLTTNTSTTTNTPSVTTSTNTSSYNSTNLPETGIQDSLPVVVLIAVLAISAVYAYKKVKDYQNI